MDKPNDYGYYSAKKNKIPYCDWPQECKDYKSYLRVIRKHPDWTGLSIEEIRMHTKELHQKGAVIARAAWRKKKSNLSPEELAKINASKSNHWKNMSDNERIAESERLRQISQDFWDGMTDEQRKGFSQYRESKLSDEQKEIRNKRLCEAGIEFMRAISPEEMARRIGLMNTARLDKLDKDDQFRQEQIRLLRENNAIFMMSMADEELNKFYHDMVAKSVEVRHERWVNDEEYRNRQIKHLRAHCRDYVDSLSPEELCKHSEQLQKSLQAYYQHMTPEERSAALHYNNLNRKFEKRFRESMVSNEFYLRPEYAVNNGDITKYWDYAVYRSDNDQLIMVIDLDGSFYHGDSSDYNGLHSKEERDEKRGYFAPEGVMIHVITDVNFTDSFKEMLKVLMVDYDEYIRKLFDEYRNMDFPYPHYTHKELIDSFKQLCRLDPGNPKLNLNIRNREGDRLILNFHHSIYHAHTADNVSPYDAWNNDELLMKCIQNRVLYQNHLNPNKIVQGFNVSKIAPKVSVFSAGRAKLLIAKYLSDYDEIFDPFSGFSGRMLGAMSLGKHYIGQDISTWHTGETHKMLDFLHAYSNANFPNIPMPVIRCEDVNHSYGTYECLFTCPPYGNKEQWGNLQNTPDRNCDEWIDICLSHFKCKQYLFVVDHTEKYERSIVDTIVNSSHFGKNKEYVILI